MNLYCVVWFYNDIGDYMKDIGLILKNTREDLDLTQIDVMRRTGINNKTLSGYENGVSEPDLETFAKLLKLYGLSADNVLDINTKKYTEEICLNNQEIKLILYFRELDERRKEDLIAVCKLLSDK